MLLFGCIAICCCLPIGGFPVDLLVLFGVLAWCIVVHLCRVAVLGV